MNLRKTIQDAIYAYVVDRLEDFQDGETHDATIDIPNTKWCLDCKITADLRTVPAVQKAFQDGDGDDWQDIEDGYVEGVTIHIESLTLCDFSDGSDAMNLILQSPNDFTFYRPLID